MRLSEAELEALMAKRGGAKPSPPSVGMAKGVEPVHKLNKLEARYADFLRTEELVGRVRWWKFHPFKLRLANPACWYEIDFCVIDADSEVNLIEVKGGHVYDDARVKFKVASELFPWFRFRWVTFEKGVWVVKTIEGGKWL